MASDAEVDWEHPYALPNSPLAQSAYRSGYSNGYREGYEAARQDMARNKAAQREVIDQAIILRFTEILASLRERTR
jgi:flagellar biosynthesis/type III secretory pathway protein FliH